MGIGAGGAALLGGCIVEESVCVDIETNSTRSLIGGGGGALVGDRGDFGALRDSSTVCDAADTIGRVILESIVT